MNPLTIFAKRFIAGEKIEDAIEVVSRLNSEGMTATVDILGENVKNSEAAHRAADAYINLLEEITASGIDSNVSLKLTQMGLDIGDDFCYKNVRRVAQTAKQRGNFVRIDMEGSQYTQRTLDVFRKLRSEFENVGTVIQAYLFRSEKDIKELNLEGSRIRLCKGAYKEPPSISFNSKDQTNENFIRLMKILLTEGTYPAIATHDPAMIEATKKFAYENSISKDRFEFQMLYGIGRKLQRELARAGYTIRVYVPYGTHWLPYFARRLRERKENIFFVLRHLFRD
ncbi:MAG: proline dehydrogenase family protein [Candidatus Glassbacteria bacterium]